VVFGATLHFSGDWGVIYLVENRATAPHVLFIGVNMMGPVMRAAISESYGPPESVEIRDVPVPVPKANDVLIKVHATTVTRTDCGMRTPYPFFIRPFIGLFKPKTVILGLDFAGIVEAIGDDVSLFKIGDRVFGLSPDRYGAHAEYLCIPETASIATMPSNINFSEAVLCEGAWYANNNLEKYNIKAGDQILIYGGGGAIGSAAIQLAKFYGAEVTSVIETRHIELVKSLGADHVIDFTQTDFSKSGKFYDFVFDSVGKSSYSKCKKVLKPNGTFSATDLGPYGQNIWLSLWSQIRRNGRVIFPLPINRKSVIEFIKARIEAGELRAVIDNRYPLDAIVEAYHRVDTEQKTGIVVIDIVKPKSGINI